MDEINSNPSSEKMLAMGTEEAKRRIKTALITDTDSFGAWSNLEINGLVERLIAALEVNTP